jgi:hypothetical protein
MLSVNTCSYAVDHLHVSGFDFLDFRAKFGRGHSDLLFLFLHRYLAFVNKEIAICFKYQVSQAKTPSYNLQLFNYVAGTNFGFMLFFNLDPALDADFRWQKQKQKFKVGNNHFFNYKIKLISLTSMNNLYDSGEAENGILNLKSCFYAFTIEKKNYIFGTRPRYKKTNVKCTT